MAKRRYLQVTLKISLAPGVTAAQARREVRSRVNDLCCYSLDESDVRVAKITPGGIVAGPAPRERGAADASGRRFGSLGEFMMAVRGPAPVEG